MTRDFPAGNYRFIPAVFQYSSGAAANPGYEIVRVRFDEKTGKVFCLSEAPDREAITAAHRAAHGLLADDRQIVFVKNLGLMFP